MTPLQLSLLILALFAIALVGLISYRRSEAPSGRRKPPRMNGAGAGAGAGSSDQMDLLGGESASGRFDEFGVGEPRRRRAADVPPRAEPTLDTTTAATEPVGIVGASAKAEKAPRAEAAATAPAKDSAKAAKPTAPRRDDKIVTLFVQQREGQDMAGSDIHRTLHHLGLEPGDRLTYERNVGGQTWFHVANMRKPGHLDPGEADRFSTPGLSLFALLTDLHDPLAATDDLLETAQRIADSLDGVVLNDAREPLGHQGSSAVREDVSGWLERHA